MKDILKYIVKADMYLPLCSDQSRLLAYSAL